MKIAIIGTAYPYRGGLAAYNERLATQFQNEGHEVKIYTFTVQYPNFLFPGKTQYSTDPGPTHLDITRCINSTNPLNWIKVGNQIRKEKFDLVIIKYWLPFMGPCFGTILRQVKKNKATRVVCIVDNMVPHESRIGDKAFTKYFVKPVEAYIAMSNTVLKDIELFDPQAPKKLSPHPLFDNFGAIQDRDKTLKTIGADPKLKYILFFGLIRKYKGLDLLLEAFADARFQDTNIRLIIAGEFYADASEYLELIERYKLSDKIIHVNKFIPDSEVATYFSAADLVVQPYKSATQSGVTQIAYHFNKPMVVTDVGGLKEMVPHERVGFVVPTQPLAIADAILKFFEGDFAQSMEPYILEEKKKYSWEILTQNILTLGA
ncbi:MAG: glycosyltransferase [Bacteroidota bacterium]